MSLPQFDDLDTSWSWIVMVASFMSLFVIGGTNYSVGMVHNVLLRKYNAGQSATALAGAIHTSVSNVAAPISSLIVDKYSVRTSVILSGVLYTVGYLSAAFASSLLVSIVTCGVIAGLGGAVAWTSSMVACSFNFRRYTNIAHGIAMAGAGAGMFGIPPLASWADQHYGSFGFFVALASVSVHSVVSGVIIRPSKLEIYAQLKRRNEHGKQAHTCASYVFSYIHILKMKVVLCLSISMFLYCSGMYMVLVYLPVYSVRQGASDMQASYILSITGVASIIGRIAIGFTANMKARIEIYLYAGTLLVFSIATFIFPLISKDYYGQVTFAVVMGLCFGGPFVMITPINLQFLGVDRITSALGLELCLCGAGGITGPIIAGTILDSGGTFEQLFMLAGVFILLAAVLGALPACLHSKSPHSPVLEAKSANELVVLDDFSEQRKHSDNSSKAMASGGDHATSALINRNDRNVGMRLVPEQLRDVDKHSRASVSEGKDIAREENATLLHNNLEDYKEDDIEENIDHTSLTVQSERMQTIS